MALCGVSSAMWSYALTASTTSMVLIPLTILNMRKLKRKPLTTFEKNPKRKAQTIANIYNRKRKHQNILNTTNLENY